MQLFCKSKKKGEILMNGDYLIRATAADEKVRAFAIRSTEMAATARETHKTLPVVTAASEDCCRQEP